MIDTKWKCNRLLKALVYRAYNTIIVFFLSLIFTSNVEIATLFTLAEAIIKTISYYIFEKIYSKDKKE